MRNSAALLLTLATCVFASAPARAQEAELPRLEFGAFASVLGVTAGSDGLVLVGGGPTVTIGLVRNLRLDFRAEIFGPLADVGVNGLYEAQVRVPLRRSSDGQGRLSMSAGVAGAFSYHRAREYRMTRPDGSIVVYPGYREINATAPIVPAIGIVHQRVVSRRASVNLGADVMIGWGAVVARASAGVSFGGRSYR